MKPISTAQAIGAFIASRKAVGRSAHTVRWYENMLRPLASRFKALPEETYPLELMLGQVAGSATTRLDHWKALRIFYNWMHRRHHFPNAAAQLERGPRIRQRPRALTDLQVDRLLLKNAGHPRDLAMLTTLLDTGMRVGELWSMTKSRILQGQHAGESIVRVTGKTGDREVLISDETLNLIAKLPYHPDLIWLTEKKRGRHIVQGMPTTARSRLTVNGIQQAIEAAFVRAGVPGSAHVLRHTFGTQFIRDGGNQFALQELLGHSNIQTTRIYVEMNQLDTLREQHNQHSPMARRLRALPDAHDSGSASLGRA